MMSKLFIYFLLWISCFSARAEDLQKPAENNMLYNRSSQLSVKKINQAVEVLRDPVTAIKNKLQSLKDPTRVNENFYQAMKKSQRGTSTTSDNAKQSTPLPTIRLLGKVYYPKNPEELLSQQPASRPVNRSSVILQIDSDVIPLHEGDSSTYIKDNRVYTLEVESITPYSVHLILNPGQQQLVLH
jgi:hypothetical protein